VGTAAKKSAAAVGKKFRDSGIAGGGNKRLSRRKRKISNKVIHNKRFSRRKHNTSKWRTLKKR
jgi:hypothetical protein